jgi:hypothetical protein
MIFVLLLRACWKGICWLFLEEAAFVWFCSNFDEGLLIEGIVSEENEIFVLGVLDCSGWRKTRF